MAAQLEEIVNEVKTLKQDNAVRASECQQLRDELTKEGQHRIADDQNLSNDMIAATASSQAEISKLKADLLAIIQKHQGSQVGSSGYVKDTFHDKNAKDFKPKEWIGDKDKVPYKDFYDSMLNWASALHDDAVESMEQAEKGKFGCLVVMA